jgi:hypothetical protein
MLLLNLNYEAFDPPTLRAYHKELLAIALDPMSAAERRAYRAVRERVATLLAFPGQG